MTLSSPNNLTPRRPSRSAQKVLENNLQQTNALTDQAFVDAYFPSGWSAWTNPRNNERYSLELRRSLDLSKDDFNACYSLIDQTSGDDYRSSSIGWSEAAKKKEMLSPDLRYILIRRPSASPPPISGFLSLMPTFEASLPVLYIYEIHLTPTLQGSGLGSHLILNLTRHMAQQIVYLDKVMLTCFRCNELALGFYARMGFDMDESSPADRTLRGGRVVTSDYVILSWRIERRPSGDGVGG